MVKIMAQGIRNGHDARHRKERKKRPVVAPGESVPRTRFGTGKGTDDRVLGDELADFRLEVLKRLAKKDPKALDRFIKRCNLSRVQEAVIRMALGAGADSEAALHRQEGADLDPVEGPSGLERATLATLEEKPDLVHQRVRKRNLQ